MSIRRFVAVAILLWLRLAVPPTAAAQRAIAPFVGREFDEVSDWIVFGGEARFTLAPSAWSINPRFTYHPIAGSKIIQLDANVVYDFKPATGPLTPYAGAGLGWTHVSGNAPSDSKAVANFLYGIRVHLTANSKVEPYVQSQYSFAKQFTNSYQLMAGFFFWM
jgi:opacity protein-like surface antigen